MAKFWTVQIESICIQQASMASSLGFYFRRVDIIAGKKGKNAITVLF